MSAKKISPEQRALRSKIGEIIDGAGLKSLSADLYDNGLCQPAEVQEYA